MMKVLPLLSLACLVDAKKLNWSTYKPTAADDPSKFIVTEAVMSDTSHHMRIVRFQRGHPTAHILLLPPAPGQGSKYWEGELNKLLGVYGEDFVLYGLDMRGDTYGDPFFDGESESWNGSTLSDSLKTTKKKMSISSLNIAGLASDVKNAADRIKDEPGFSGKIHLHARSFGSMIAIKAIEGNSTLFDSVLFESPLVPSSLMQVQNDASFLSLCNNDSFCRRQFNGIDPTQLRHTLITLATPEFNACTIALIETLKKEKIGRLPGDSSDSLRIQEFLQPFLQGKIEIDHYHSALITIPFLSATYLCPNADKYKEDILPKMIKYVKDAKNPFSRFNSLSNDLDVNRFTNTFLMAQDVFQMSSEKENICSSTMPIGLASPCITYRYYHKYYKALKPILKKTTTPYNEVKGPGTRMFFVGGALDLITPLKSTNEFFTNSSGKEKRFFKFDTLGHHPLSKGVCAKEIGKEVLGRGTPSTTDSCISVANEQKIDWKLPKLSFVTSWWSGSTDAPAPPPPKKSDDPSNSTSNSWVFYAFLIVGSLAIVAVVGHVGYTLYKRRQGKAEEF